MLAFAYHSLKPTVRVEIVMIIVTAADWDIKNQNSLRLLKTSLTQWPSSSKFSCLLCAVCVDYNVSRWLNPNFLEHYFTLIMSGMTSVLPVFVVSSFVACVGKGRISAAIFIRHLGCTSGWVCVPCIFTHARWVTVGDSGLCCCTVITYFER